MLFCHAADSLAPHLGLRVPHPCGLCKGGVFPMVTFSPHLRHNSPRLNDLAIRSNGYLISKRFLLTTSPGPGYDCACYLEETSPTPPATPALTLAFSYYCKLFVVAKKVNPFGIKQIQTLSTKYRGWGCPPAQCLCACPL